MMKDSVCKEFILILFMKVNLIIHSHQNKKDLTNKKEDFLSLDYFLPQNKNLKSKTYLKNHLKTPVLKMYQFVQILVKHSKK